MLLTAEDVREIDRRCAQEFGIPTLLLMESAGRAVATAAADMAASDLAVAVVCGTGNNGGDGFVAARYLLNRGLPVQLFLVGRLDKMRADSAAAVNLAILRRMDVVTHHILDASEAPNLTAQLQRAVVIVDALLGIGLSTPMRPLQRAVVDAINAAKRPVVAVDIPSGLHADNGAPLPIAVKAHTTVTFVAPKKGLLTEKGRSFVGKIVVADIGVPRSLLKQFGEVPRYDII